MKKIRTGQISSRTGRDKMAELDFTFEDNSDLTREEFDLAIKRALKAIGMQAESYAKQSINERDAIDTGRLINSVTYGTSERHGTHNYSDNNGKRYSQEIGLAEEDAVYVGTSVEYAAYIEYGHHSYPPVHFLKNAAANHTDEYRQIIEDSLKNA